jgi:TATA-box binding protein (TBP) (component of TFIID and TFIIIB)
MMSSSAPVFFITIVEDLQVEPLKQQLLLAPSASSSSVGQKRQLRQMQDDDNDVHQCVGSHHRKVYSNKRRRLNQQQSNDITFIGLLENSNSSECGISSSATAVDPNNSTTATTASSINRQVNNTNIVSLLSKAQTRSINNRPVTLPKVSATSLMNSVNVGSAGSAADHHAISCVASTSKQNNNGENADDDETNKEQRFLKAIDIEQRSFSKAELARLTKLPINRINQLVAKYCDKVSPGNSQSKVFLKPEFRTTKSAQENFVLFTAMPYIAFAAQDPCSSFIQLPSSSVAVESQSNPASAIVLSAEKACASSTPTVAVNAARRSAKKVTTFRKIACKRQASDDIYSGKSFSAPFFLSSASPSATKRTRFNNEISIENNMIPIGCCPSAQQLEHQQSTPAAASTNNAVQHNQMNQHQQSVAEPSKCSAADPITIQPLKVSNINASFDVNCTLDLQKIARNGNNVMYEKNNNFTVAVDMKIRNPEASFRIFKSGKIVCNGTKTEKDAKVAARRCARIIQKLGFPSVKFSGFQINNIVAHFSVQHPSGRNPSSSFLQRVQHKLDVQFHFKNTSEIDSELRLDGKSTALTYYLTKTSSSSPDFSRNLAAATADHNNNKKIVTAGTSTKNKDIINYSCTAVIFHNGKVNILGAKCMADVQQAYDLILPIMENEQHPSLSQHHQSTTPPQSHLQHQCAADDVWLNTLLNDFMPTTEPSTVVINGNITDDTLANAFSSTAAASTAPNADATKVINTVRKIACKRQASDSDNSIDGALIPPSSAAKKTCFNNENRIGNNTISYFIDHESSYRCGP